MYYIFQIILCISCSAVIKKPKAIKVKCFSFNDKNTYSNCTCNQLKGINYVKILNLMSKNYT